MTSPDGQVAGPGLEFGLRKETIVSRGRDSTDYESQRYVAPATGRSDMSR